METRKARVVGEVTALGYLFCVACHPDAGEETGSTAVYAGSPPHSEEECDLCHRVLDAKFAPKPGEVVVVSEIPACNFCQDGTPGPYDFATKQGPWANGCETHWKQHRASADLGVGKGQLWITEEQADRRPLLDANSANPLEASIARLRSEEGTELLVRVHPQTVPTTAAPFHPTATHVDALGMPVAFTEYGSYHPTPCCGAAASISDGPMYCKACYSEVDPAFGNVPVEPFRLISETEQA